MNAMSPLKCTSAPFIGRRRGWPNADNVPLTLCPRIVDDPRYTLPPFVSNPCFLDIQSVAVHCTPLWYIVYLPFPRTSSLSASINFPASTHSPSSSTSPYSNVYMGSMYHHIPIPPCSTVYTFSTDRPFSLLSYLTLSNRLLLSLPLFLVLSFPSPFFLRSGPLFSFHHLPTPLRHPFQYSICDYPQFRCPSYSFISYLVQLRKSAHPS